MIKGKSPEEIRKTFNIQNDFTPEEEDQIRRENEWAEEWVSFPYIVITSGTNRPPTAAKHLLLTRCFPPACPELLLHDVIGPVEFIAWAATIQSGMAFFYDQGICFLLAGWGCHGAPLRQWLHHGPGQRYWKCGSQASCKSPMKTP